MDDIVLFGKAAVDEEISKWVVEMFVILVDAVVLIRIKLLPEIIIEIHLNQSLKF